MKTRKTRKRKNNPSPAQLRARAKFVKMVRARAAAKKRANPRGRGLRGATAKQERQYELIKRSERRSGRSLKDAKRIAAATVRGRAKNKTIIKARRVKIMATNPRRRNAKASGFIVQFVREMIRDGQSIETAARLMDNAGFTVEEIQQARSIYKTELAKTEKDRAKELARIYRKNPRKRRNAVALPALASSLRQQYDSAGLRKLRDRLRTNIQHYQGLTRKLTKQLKTERDSGRAQDLRRQLAEIDRLESREVSQLDDVLRKLSGATSIRKPRRNAESWRKVRVSRLRAQRGSGDREAERALAILQRGKRRLKESRRIVKKYTKNPGVTARSRATRKLFTGMKSKKTLSLLAPTGTRKSVAILGKLVKIKTRSRTFTPPKRNGRNPEGEIYLAADDSGQLVIVGENLPVVPGPARDLGEIIELDYATRKPHLGYDQTTEFFHELGEEGGERPHLVTDSEGHLKIAGGDYYIERDGIHD